MPSARIPLSHTNQNKLNAVNEFETLDLTHSEYCRQIGVKRTTHLTWTKRREKIQNACEIRPRALNVGGSGRKSGTHDVETRSSCGSRTRGECDDIIKECMALLPDFFVDMSLDARLYWCNRFRKRSGLPIRRISHSGRKKKDKLDTIKDTFIIEVSTLLITHFVDSSASLPQPYVLYNIDQTSVYCHLGARTTADFVGVTRVPCTLSRKGGYRCTVALTICADGRLLIPYFVFKGAEGKGVHEEVSGYCEPDTAAIMVQGSAWFDERVMLD